MIAIDTNVLVRFLTGDDRWQFEKARHLFETENILIPVTVLLETEWVLRYAYQFQPQQIADTFAALLGLPMVYAETPRIIAQALEWHIKGLDFADALHLAKSPDAQAFVTFDKDLIKNGTVLSPIPLREP